MARSLFLLEMRKASKKKKGLCKVIAMLFLTTRLSDYMITVLCVACSLLLRYEATGIRKYKVTERAHSLFFLETREKKK